MKLDIAPTTRMAIRAAVVATAAVVVSRISILERPYWIVLTSVLLIYETAGESIKRSGQRLAMTLVGCLTGWLLYTVAGPIPTLRWTILLGGVFLTVYFRSNPRGVVYAPMIFFASVYVVFVFAVVGGWTGKLFVTRVYDTAIGCALALAGSLLVLPRRAGHLVADDLETFWESCSQYFEKTLAALETRGEAPNSADRQALLKQLEQLRMRSRNSAFEGFLGRGARQRELVDSSELLSRHLLAYGAVMQADVCGNDSLLLRRFIEKLAIQVKSGFARLVSGAGNQSIPLQAASNELSDGAYADAMQSLDAGSVDRDAFLQLSPAVYHLNEVCKGLQQCLAMQGLNG